LYLLSRCFIDNLEQCLFEERKKSHAFLERDTTPMNDCVLRFGLPIPIPIPDCNPIVLEVRVILYLVNLSRLSRDQTNNTVGVFNYDHLLLLKNICWVLVSHDDVCYHFVNNVAHDFSSFSFRTRCCPRLSRRGFAVDDFRFLIITVVFFSLLLV
jgi:hypothetical protein